MAKPWEQDWQAQSGKPWERNYGAAPEHRMEDAVPGPGGKFYNADGTEYTAPKSTPAPASDRWADKLADVGNSLGVSPITDPLIGGAEAVLSGGMNLFGKIMGGTAGVGQLAVTPWLDPNRKQGPADTSRGIEDFFTYKPGQRGQNLLSPVAEGTEQVMRNLPQDPVSQTLVPAYVDLVSSLSGMKAGGGVRALERAAPKEPGIKIDVADTGQTVATLGENGKSVFDAQESGPYLQIKRADIDPALQGNGHGTRVLKELQDHAETRGLTLGSDVSVSPSAAGMYRKMKAEGYEVKQNPSNINPETGNIVSLDPKKPVFEVRRIAEDGKNKSPKQVKQDAIDLLLKNDVPLRTSERGDSPLQQTAGKLGRAGDTFAGGPSGKQATQNQAFTAAVFKKAGMDVQNVTAEAMAELKQNVTELYNKAHALPLELDTDFVSGLAELADKAKRNPDAGVGSGIERLIENVSKNSKVEHGKAILPTEYVSQLRSELGSSWLGASGAGAKTIGGEFMQLLDDAVERKATPEQSTAAKAARLKYHQMRQIEDSLVLTDKGMIVSPNKLVNTLAKKRNRSEYHYGTGGNQELVALAKAGKQILGDKVGNSGTATRGIDVGTVADLAIEPRKAVGRIANASASILTGRALNELNMTRGTAADVAKKAAKAEVNSIPAPFKNPITKNITIRGAALAESEEQKRKREAAALRR